MITVLQVLRSISIQHHLKCVRAVGFKKLNIKQANRTRIEANFNIILDRTLGK